MPFCVWPSPCRTANNFGTEVDGQKRSLWIRRDAIRMKIRNGVGEADPGGQFSANRPIMVSTAVMSLR